VYLRYVNEFPRPLEIAVETRFKIAGMYETKGDETLYHRELQEIVAMDAAAGDERTNRTKFLAAQSGLVLSERVYAEFAVIRLVQPFEQSLVTKRERMDRAMQSFESLIDYEVAEVTAAATYYMAEIYYGFSRSLLESERPADLDAAAAADYELVIEEEAFPFEEQAIDVHEKNRELITAGVYNEWVEKSLEKLALLMPGRYAKSEMSSGFLPTIAVYAYRSPNAPDPNAVAAAGETLEASAADDAADEALGTPDAENTPVESAAQAEPALDAAPERDPAAVSQEDSLDVGADQTPLDGQRIRQATAPGVDDVLL
jgi:hypothetical protein